MYSTCGTCTPVLYFLYLYACAIRMILVHMYSAYCTHMYISTVFMVLVRLYILIRMCNAYCTCMSVLYLWYVCMCVLHYMLSSTVEAGHRVADGDRHQREEAPDMRILPPEGE